MTSILIVAILLLFTIGFVCGWRFNQTRTDKKFNNVNTQIEASLSDVVYEDILPNITSQNETVEMHQNTAYGPPKPVVIRVTT